MPNYGLPLIFKAVNVETGEEERLDWSYGRLNLMHGEGIKILQQASLTFPTASGKCVYVGDVLAKRSDEVIVFAVVKYSLGNVVAQSIKDEWLNFSAHLFPDFYIVGNAYEPPAKWLERARAIWPDAQLPEGVRG